jgi:hypothetical protein
VLADDFGGSEFIEDESHGKKLKEGAFGGRSEDTIGAGFGLPDHAGPAAKGEKRLSEPAAAVFLWDAEGIERLEDTGDGSDGSGAEGSEFLRECSEPAAATVGLSPEECAEGGEETIFLIGECPLSISLIKECCGEGDKNFIDEFVGIVTCLIEEEIAEPCGRLSRVGLVRAVCGGVDGGICMSGI